MSEKERQNLSEKDHGSDDKQNENSEEVKFDNTVEGNRNSPGIAHHMLQENATNNIEVNPIDVITVEDVSHESIEKNFNESSQLKVIEFPCDDDEIETDSHLFQACAGNMGRVPFQASPQDSVGNSYVLASIKKLNGELIEVVDTESLNKKDPDVICTTETLEESVRKRKKGQIPVMQNKRHKELQSSCIPVIQCSSTEDVIEVQSSSSGEFADAEDSSSSDNNGSNSSNKTLKQIPLKDLPSGIHKGRERKIESLDKMTSTKAELSDIFHPNICLNDHFEEKTLFPSFLKGETLPAFKLTDEAKKKFELSMPTIFEVQESSSDEKIHQPLQSKTNPLKMITRVGKRKDKCNICNVRLGLCAIECRCGGYYCARHRYDKEHNCTFDYKSMGAAEIRKNNPKIVAEKIRKL